MIEIKEKIVRLYPKIKNLFKLKNMIKIQGGINQHHNQLNHLNRKIANVIKNKIKRNKKYLKAIEIKVRQNLNLIERGILKILKIKVN